MPVSCHSCANPTSQNKSKQRCLTQICNSSAHLPSASASHCILRCCVGYVFVQTSSPSSLPVSAAPITSLRWRSAGRRQRACRKIGGMEVVDGAQDLRKCTCYCTYCIHFERGYTYLDILITTTNFPPPFHASISTDGWQNLLVVSTNCRNEHLQCRLRINKALGCFIGGIPFCNFSDTLPLPSTTSDAIQVRSWI